MTDQLHELLRWPPRDPADPMDALFLAIAARHCLPTAEEETRSTAVEEDTGPFMRQMAEIERQVNALRCRYAELS